MFISSVEDYLHSFMFIKILIDLFPNFSISLINY